MLPNVPHPFEPPIRKVGVVGVFVQENKLLVIERSQHVRAPGRHCFPGGSMEPGETEEQTLIREMQEELGVPVRPIRRIYRSVSPWRVDLRWWHATIDCTTPLSLAPLEVAAADWYSVAEMLTFKTLLDSNRDFLGAWQRGAFEIEGLLRDE